MIDFLVKMVMLGRISVEQIPEKYRDAVIEKLGDPHD